MQNFEQSIEKANHVLRDLGRMNGLEIELNEHGTAFVKVENQYPLTLQLTTSGNFLKLTAYVGECHNISDPKILEYLLVCNYEADFIKGCSIGLCKLTQKLTLSFMHPLLSSDAILLNNCILNMGVAIRDLDKEIITRTQSSQPAMRSFGKQMHTGLSDILGKRL